MDYFVVDMRCKVTNEGTCSGNPNGTHIAGRHIYIQADSEQDAMEKTSRYYKREQYTKVLSAKKVNFVPPENVTIKVP